jgi:outer membrane protein assembly factor BamE (lipoprotein component of BamABCDE complex)
LGPPSTKSTFDNDLWIYIERKISKSNILTLGKKTTVKNNVLVLEINTRGLLVKKDFINIEDMNELNFSKETTINIYSKKSIIKYLRMCPA